MALPNLDRLGRYEQLEPIARGGMGVVYRAVDPVLDRPVAIKALDADTADPVVRAQFMREARAAANLQHENIVTVFEFFEYHGLPCIVMELLHGETLDARLRREPPPSVAECVQLAVQLCRGLHHAHEHGVIHRDVKPGNVWITLHGTVKLLDFGIARLGAHTLGSQSRIVGTPSYMSPEQASGRAIDRRTDIFSAGALLYQLFSGARPFEGESIEATLYQILSVSPRPVRTINPRIPSEIADIVSAALEKDPTRRPGTAAQIADCLLRCRLDQLDTKDLPLQAAERALRDVAPEEHSSSTPTVRIRDGRRTRLVVAIVLAMALVTGALVFRRGSEVTTSASGSGESAPRPAAAPPATPVPERQPIAFPRTITFRGSYPFEIVEGSRLLSSPSMSHRLALDVATPRTLRLVARRYFLDRAITLDRRAPTTVEAPATGRLQLRSPRERCRVVFAGRDLGYPPFELLIVAAGRHALQLTCPGTARRPVEQIDVRPDVLQTHIVR